MKDEHFNQLIGFLELVGVAFDKGISIIDKDYRIIWVNSILEKKGFKLGNVKGTFYKKTFENSEKIEDDDPTHKSIKSGQIVTTIKRGGDGREYHVVDIPMKAENGNLDFVVEFTKDLEEQKNAEIQKLKDFIFERELKMAELKNQLGELKSK